MYFKSKNGTTKLVLGRFVYIPISINSKIILLGQKNLTGFIKTISKIMKDNKQIKKLRKNNDFCFYDFLSIFRFKQYIKYI
jgi:hypothetical protein